MQPLAMKNDRHYTYADYLKFPEEERWEIIDGVAYNMSPAPSDAHQDLSSELNAQVRTQLRGKRCQVRAAPYDVRFENSEQTRTVVQPDLIVVCDRNKITTRGLVSAPDWVVEILSPSTAGKDHIVKRALYERHGVREYWLVHPVDGIVAIHRLGPNGHYAPPETLELRGKTAVAAVPELEIDWDLWRSSENE